MLTNIWIIRTQLKYAIPAKISDPAPDGNCKISWLEIIDNKNYLARGCS